MKRYKVQWAYPLEIGTPVIHTSEPAARGEVAYLLGVWIRRSLEDYLQRVQSSPIFKRYPEFEQAVAYLIPEIQRFISEDLVWDAYDLWEEFYVRFENATGKPLYLMLPTVIVEGSRETGLKNRVPLMDPSEDPQEKIEGFVIPIRRLEEKKLQLADELLEVVAAKADLKGVRITRRDFVEALIATEMQLVKSGQYQYADEETEREFLEALREGTLRKLFPKNPSIGLGAFQRWLVQYADFGGAWHPGRHTNEDRAKEETRHWLKILMEHLETHASSEALVRRRLKYVAEAEKLLQELQYLIDNDLIWTAYLDYKAFEQKWDREFAPFSLQMSIGTMRVIPTPEPE